MSTYSNRYTHKRNESVKIRQDTPSQQVGSLSSYFPGGENNYNSKWEIVELYIAQQYEVN